jgi:hypothetical protein
MKKDERGSAFAIARRLRGLELALDRTLHQNITDEERAQLSARQGIYSGIADDIDRDFNIDSTGPELTGKDVGMAGSKKLTEFRCFDEHSARRMLSAAPRMECRLCMKPTEIFIAVPNDYGFNVLPGYCKEHGVSMLRPYEGSTVAQKLDDAVSEKRELLEASLVPSPLTEEAMSKAWEGAKALLRSKGVDPDDMVRRAAANVDAWRQKGSSAEAIPEAWIQRLAWLRDTVGVDVERMFARAQKEKDGRESDRPSEAIPQATPCGRGHWASNALKCTREAGHDGSCMFTIEAVIAACQPPAAGEAKVVELTMDNERLRTLRGAVRIWADARRGDDQLAEFTAAVMLLDVLATLDAAKEGDVKPPVPRYYEAIGPNKDSDESKRLEGVINNIVHEVLTETSHAPDCASFDFDPEKQLGPDKPCDCGKNKP